jgi:hypothetical protein
MVLQELFNETNRVKVQFAWRQDASGRLIAAPYVVRQVRSGIVPIGRRASPTRIGAILIERQRRARALNSIAQPTLGQRAGAVADGPPAPAEAERSHPQPVRL